MVIGYGFGRLVCLPRMFAIGYIRQYIYRYIHRMVCQYVSIGQCPDYNSGTPSTLPSQPTDYDAGGGHGSGEPSARRGRTIRASRTGPGHKYIWP